MFELKNYLQLLMDEQYIDAKDYRVSNMPTKVFKYVSLTTEPSDKLNSSKFDTLINDKCWLSTKENLNDPFEMRSNFIDKKRLIDANWDVEYCENVFSAIQKIFLIGSFTTTATDNMPMWAHYAGNHSGFCTEYEIINPEYFYKVSYENTRIGIANIIMNYIARMSEVANGSNFENKDMEFMQVFMHMPSIKHTSWSYENEYRLVYINFNKAEVGESISNSKLGIKISKVYLGSQMSSENKSILTEICKGKNIRLEEVYFEDSLTEFTLSTKPV